MTIEGDAYELMERTFSDFAKHGVPRLLDPAGIAAMPNAQVDTSCVKCAVQAYIAVIHNAHPEEHQSSDLGKGYEK